MKKITFTSIFILSILFSLSGISQSTATYDISFTSTWNAADHGTLPSNAHWSNLVGANHNSNVSFLELGSVASAGIEGVAEIGSNTVFNAEVQSAIDFGDADNWLQASFSPFAAISSATLPNIVVSEDHSLITLVAMIAPSPDWIIAVNSLELWDSNLNQWKATFEIDLFPYDAGTENGFEYSGNNTETDPRGIITNIAGATGYPFNSEKIGILTLTFKSTTLGITTLEYLNEVRIRPNPVGTGVITITNATQLGAIEVYDVLGKKVKQMVIDTTESTKSIAISELNKGIYILRLTHRSGARASKKLIVN